MNKEDEKLLRSFASHLRDLRLEKGLTQEDLATQTNLSRTHITRLESGRYNPSMLALKAIAKSLNISLKELLDFEA